MVNNNKIKVNKDSKPITQNNALGVPQNNKKALITTLLYSSIKLIFSKNNNREHYKS